MRCPICDRPRRGTPDAEGVRPVCGADQRPPDMLAEIMCALHGYERQRQRAEKAEAEREQAMRRLAGFIGPAAEGRTLAEMLEMAFAHGEASTARRKAIEAERDRARKVARELREALSLMDVAGTRQGISAPEDAAVEALCVRWGFGAVMDAAARLWRRRAPDLEGGCFLVGPCLGTVRAALALDPDAPEGGQADHA